MTGDSNSGIAWHKVQLKKNRAALKALEIARFKVGHIADPRGQTEKAMAGLKRKIAESERWIADYERRTRRPLGTDVRSLASVRWSNWNTRGAGRF